MFSDRVFREPLSDGGEVVSEVVVDEIEVSVELFGGELEGVISGDGTGFGEFLSEGSVEVSCDTRLGRVEESEDVLVGVDEVSVDRAVVGHDERDIKAEGLPEEGIDLCE